MTTTKPLKSVLSVFTQAITILFFVICGLISFATQAQVEEKQAKHEEDKTVVEEPAIQQHEASEDKKVYVMVEEMPEFPGGDKAFREFVNNNLRYPQEAIEAGIEGSVFITFTVETDGSISDIKSLRGIGGGCDEEAIRIIEAMPKWIPGKNKGRPVKVQCTIPIEFSMKKEQKQNQKGKPKRQK